jgi:hypothetical protein
MTKGKKFSQHRHLVDAGLLVLVERVGEEVGGRVVVVADEIDDVRSFEVLLEERRLDGLTDEGLGALESLVEKLKTY